MADVISSPAAGHQPGTARIKSEFLTHITPWKQLEPGPTEAHVNKGGEPSSPPRKKKRRGRNKHRPRTVRDKCEDCLCPSLVNDDRACKFEDTCKYLHDVSKFMSTKPEDIGKECHMYKTHGICKFGFACRYGSGHILKAEDGSYAKLRDEEKMAANPVPAIINTFPRDVLISWGKRKYEFVRSNKVLTKSSSKPLVVDVNKDIVKDGAKTGDSQSKCTSEIVPLQSNGGLEIPEESSVANGAVEHARQSLQNVATGTTIGCVTNGDLVALKKGEKRSVKFDGKLFLAPLTTVGNLPFRVTCKSLGADITCGEMAMATCLLQGKISEWALLKRHPCEDVFGVQLCGAFPDTMTKCAELVDRECQIDFIDINMGCPIDLVFKKGEGSALMQRTKKLFDIVESMNSVMTVPLTCKMRTGVESKHNTAHTILPKLRDFGVTLCTVHGRSRQARYTKLADWEYLKECAEVAAPMPLFGNGDILSFEDYNTAMESKTVAGVMIARGALIKPWIFTEIKEQRHWDISSSERFDILKKYTNTGLMHWGSDTRGVETTRRFLLEWLSFLHRYIPVGVLEQTPQKINEKPPAYMGRNDLESLMADRNCKAWVELSEMLLGKVPDGFQFLPKHKANSYS